MFFLLFEKYSNLKCGKSVQWELSCSMQTDGQSDMTQLIVALQNFANATKHPCSVPKEE